MSEAEDKARELLKKGDDPLVWDLEKIHNRKRAVAFIMQFKKTLCVYSGPVQQLYSNYDIFLPEDEDRKLVILPNPHAHHDTFFKIPESAVTPTGLNIIPGSLVGKQGLFIAMPSKNPDEPPKTMPLTVGLHAIMKRHTPERPFLPVLTKGAVREFQTDVPCVHLHKINIDRITALSSLELQGIIRAISDKISVYLYPKKVLPPPVAQGTASRAV
ncbi:MAG TPA: hypothetical protein PLF22_07850 [Pseudomonadales bacterium]|nr:hypothetical protein [Pseudomonadales bacterium]